MINRIKKGLRGIRDGYKSAKDLYKASREISEKMEKGISPEESYRELKKVRGNVEPENTQSFLKQLGYSFYFMIPNLKYDKQTEIDLIPGKISMGRAHEDLEGIEKKIKEQEKELIESPFFRLACSGNERSQYNHFLNNYGN